MRSPTCPSKLLSVVGTQKTNSPLRSEIASYLPAVFVFFSCHTSLRSPNAKNKFAFALGDRKLPAGSLRLFFLPHSGRCHQVADPGHAPVIRRGASASGLVAFHGVPSYRTAGNPAGSSSAFFLLPIPCQNFADLDGQGIQVDGLIY